MFSREYNGLCECLLNPLYRTEFKLDLYWPILIKFSVLLGNTLLRKLKNGFCFHFVSRTQKAAKKLSSVWRDRPLPPLDTAVYWVEHVARHGGDHLRPASADLPLYRYLLLDVISFLFIIFFILAFAYYKFLVCLYSMVCGSKKKSKKE